MKQATTLPAKTLHGLRHKKRLMLLLKLLVVLPCLAIVYANIAVLRSSSLLITKLDIGISWAFIISVALSLVAIVFRTAASRVILSTILPTLVVLYLFEATQPIANNAMLGELIAKLKQQRLDGTKTSLQYTPKNFVINKAVLSLPDGTSILPLSGPSDQNIIACREGARPFVQYKADHFGMNNPNAAWTAPPFVALVGDSFTYGACVEEQHHFAQVIRAQYPGTINLAFGGYGPFSELASIREYASKYKPKYVFWLYDENNDVFSIDPSVPSDMSIEQKHSILIKYLDPKFNQNLYARQTHINNALNNYVDHWIEDRLNATSHMKILLEYLKLPHLRNMLSRYLTTYPHPTETAVATVYGVGQFATILGMAKNEVEAWGGKLVFVNIPSLQAACAAINLPLRDSVSAVPRKLGLDIIDLDAHLLNWAREHGSMRLAGEGSCGGHFSEEGYGLISGILIDYLRLSTNQKLSLPPDWERSKDGKLVRLTYGGSQKDRTSALSTNAENKFTSMSLGTEQQNCINANIFNATTNLPLELKLLSESHFDYRTYVGFESAIKGERLHQQSVVDGALIVSNKAVILNSDHIRADEGAAFLGGSLAPKNASNLIRVSVRAPVFSTSNTTLVLTVFRIGQNKPSRVVVQRAAAGSTSVLEASFETEALSKTPLGFEVRVGSLEGQKIFLNGSPSGKNSRYDYPTLHIQEYSRPLQMSCRYE